MWRWGHFDEYAAKYVAFVATAGAVGKTVLVLHYGTHFSRLALAARLPCGASIPPNISKC